MLSFIVPAHDEEALIGRTLRAIDAAARPFGAPFEIIVVDDASTDATAAIAAAAAARVVPVALRQIAAVRNAGARAAIGDRLVFVDADTLVNEAVVRAAIAAMDGGAVGGGCAVRFDGRIPLYARLLLPAFMAVYRAMRLAAGCFIFCTRDAFAAVGGFDETLFASEEVALSAALRRHGRFAILRESVTTSGRKLRAHAPREIFVLAVKTLLSGGRAVRRREGLDLWYGPRRPDPGAPAT
jgi:glycosyltransferase involved in cell wall biosynthesis